MKLKTEIIIPLSFTGIYGIENVMMQLTSKASDIKTFSLYINIFKAFEVILVAILYFFFYFLFRKKQTINPSSLFFLFILYMIAFILPFVLGKVDITYNLWTFLYFLKISMFAIALYLMYDRVRIYNHSKELEKQNIKSELALLKNQLNPHFLFNTLNNIDSLIKTNPSHASESLIEMSDMMRYMIYETDTNKVPLTKELKYIQDYLDLQKLQYSNKELVLFSTIGNPEKTEVAPMLFISFIENAFKHTTHKDMPGAICLSFNITTDKIIFKALNRVDKTKIISKDSSSGIGLETVKRRLNLLYPNKHTLLINEKNDLFCVILILEK